MKILVTGASGFVGNHVLNYLTQTYKFEIIATSRRIDKVMNAPWFSKVTYIEADLSSKQINWFDFFQKPDMMIHLAWSNLPNYTESFHLTENLPNDIVFINNMIENGLKQISITGTCFEYGLVEGELHEEMPTHPENPYAIAKDKLRRHVEYKSKLQAVNFKWLRLFYMFGEGQSTNSIIPQLQKAINNGELQFNMSGGEQVRDYLPIEKVAEYIVESSLNTNLQGIINISSGKPIKLHTFVMQYLESIGKHIELNLGYYPYSKLEPMEFWGNTNKLKNGLMHEELKKFYQEKESLIASNQTNQDLQHAKNLFNEHSNKAKYSYNFSWMGRPIIAYPQDMIAMQEIIWDIKPDLIIEAGIAHGGSLVYYASILELIGGDGMVLGLDIDIRKHNRDLIESHPMMKRIQMIEGDSTSKEVADQVYAIAKNKKRVIVCLDSNHTHDHVLKELELYAHLTTLNSYCIVFDTIVEELPSDYMPGGRPWNPGNNPKTAVFEFLKSNSDFVIDKSIDNKILISVAPDGYLKKIK